MGCLSFAAYVLTAAPGVFWLDSGELAAAGVTLGVPHPPGHPLYVILAYVASWIPMGSVAFRVTLLSAALAAVSACLVYDLVLRLLPPTGREPEDVGSWDRAAAALAALSLAASSAVWLQSVRAEVYTLQLALHLWVIRELVIWRFTPSPRPDAPLWRAALGLGLGAANHHLLLVAHVPALIVLFVSAREERSRAPWLVTQGGLWSAWGLCLYGLLPIRAATFPLVNYGDPSTLGRFADVVTARVFQASVTEVSPNPGENLLGAATIYGDGLGPVMLVFSLLGLGWMARHRPVIALSLVVAVGGNLATKVSMVLDATNPDAAGYFQTGLAMMAIAGGLGLSAALRSVRHPWAQVTMAALVGLTSGAQAWTSLERHDLTDHRSPMVADMLLLSRVAPDALWLTSFYGLHFNRLYHGGVDGFRPDVIAIHQGFEGHVNGGRSLGAAHRHRASGIERLTDAFSASGRFPGAEVEAMASQRPIYLEPTFGLPIPPERLAYGGGYVRVLTRPGSAPQTYQAHGQDTRDLIATLGRELGAQREARITLSLLLVQRVVVALKRGEAEEARRDLETVLRLSPNEPSVGRLRPVLEALEAAQGHPSPRALEDVLIRIRSTDFSDLFSQR